MKRFFKLNSPSFVTSKNKRSVAGSDDGEENIGNRRRSSAFSFGFSPAAVDRLSLNSSGGGRSGSVVSSNWSAQQNSPTSDSTGGPPKMSGRPLYVVEVSSNRDRLFTKLHKACWTGDLEKVRKAIKKIDVNVVDSEMRTPLHLAAARSHKDIIWFLLGSKAQPNRPDRDGNTPLLKAVQTRRVDIVQFLLDRGGDPRASNLAGATGLHIAAHDGQQNIVSALITSGAIVNASDQNGCTPLHIVAANGHTEVAEILLRFGASVNMADNKQRTCLMLACEEGSISMVQLFLNHGAEVAFSSSLGLTAADFARLAGHDDCLRLLSANSEKGTSEMVHAEFRRTSIVDRSPDFKSVDLDSWNDDDEDDASAASMQPKKKILQPDFNLSKFLDETDESLSDNKSVGSKRSVRRDSTLQPVQSEQLEHERLDPLPIVRSEDQLRFPPDLPPAPPKPKRVASLESCASIVETPALPPVAITTTVLAAVEDDLSVAAKRARDVNEKDLMAELGLSEISQFSSSGPSSAKDEDTDHELDFADDHTKIPEIELDTFIGPIQVKPEKSGEIGSFEMEPESTISPIVIVKIEEEETDTKQYCDWDDSLNDSVHVEPAALYTEVEGESVIKDFKSNVEFADDKGVTASSGNLNAATNEVDAESLVEIAVISANGRYASSAIVDEPISDLKNDSFVEKPNISMTDGTLGRIDTMHGVDEIWLRNPSRAVAIDLGESSSPSSSSSNTHPICAVEPENVEDANGGEEDGIFRAELVNVNSKDNTLQPAGSAAIPQSDAWDQLWLRVCGKLLLEGSDSIDESSADDENGNGKNTTAWNRDASMNLQTFQELSSADDQSSLSLKEDQTYRLLVSGALGDPTPATAVHRLATMVQHLRRAWLSEQAHCGDLEEKISGLNHAQHDSKAKTAELNAVLTDQKNKMTQLEHELESTKRSLEAEAERTRETRQEVDRRREQLVVADARYIEEASERQKAELRARAAELEAENSQLALVEAQKGLVAHKSASVDAMTQSEAVANDDGVYVEALLELEAIRYKEQLDALSALLRSAEDEVCHLKSKISQFTDATAETAALREDMMKVLFERDSVIIQRDEFASKCDALMKEVATCTQQMEESQRKSEAVLQEMLNVREKLEAELKSKEDENARLEAEIMLDKAELQAVQVKCSNLKAELKVGESWADMARQEAESGLRERWEAALRSVRADYDAAERVLIDRNDSLTNTVGLLRTEIKATTDREADFRRELEAANRRLAILRSSSEDLDERNSHLNLQLKERVTEIGNVRVELARCQENLKAVEEQVISADRRSAESDVARTAEYARLAEAFRSMEESRADVTRQLANVKMREGQLEVTLEGERAELKSAQDLIRNLEDELKKVTRGSVAAKLNTDFNDADQFGVIQRATTASNSKMSHESPSTREASSRPSKSVKASNYTGRESVANNECENSRWCQSFDCPAQQVPLPDDEDFAIEDENDDRNGVTMRKRCMNRKSRAVCSDHSNCVDRSEVELMKRQLELEARDEMNRKLEQINDILEERTKSNVRMDRSQSQLRGIECVGALRELQNEVGRLHRSLEWSESRHASLEQHCANLCELIEAKRRVKSKLKRRSTDEPTDGGALNVNAITADADRTRRRRQHASCPIYDFGKFTTDNLHASSFLSTPANFNYYNNDLRAAITHRDVGSGGGGFSFDFKRVLGERNNEPSFELRKPSAVNFDLTMPIKPSSDCATTSFKRKALF